MGIPPYTTVQCKTQNTFTVHCVEHHERFKVLTGAEYRDYCLLGCDLCSLPPQTFCLTSFPLKYFVPPCLRYQSLSGMLTALFLSNFLICVAHSSTLKMGAAGSSNIHISLYQIT
jgi:hypothetical protein